MSRQRIPTRFRLNRILLTFVHVILVIFTAFFVAGCAGQPPSREFPALQELALDRLEADFTAENPIGALETLDILRRRGFVGEAEVEAYELQIGTLLNGLYHTAMEDEEWERALTLRGAADLAGFELTAPAAGDSDLLLKLLEGLLESKGRVPAYTRAYTALQEGRLTPDQLEFLRQDARTQGYEGYAHLLDPTGPEEAGRLRDDLPGIVDSTVTIWVNRGIRVESGMGFPDRVIGSGFFIDSDGYILTNHHVIESEVDPEYEGFSRLYIRRGGTSSVKIPARVVGWDPLLDLALLKTEIRPDYLFTPGRARLRLGDPIYAIGSPGGLEKTITSGIVSAADRRLLQLGDAMQIDVPINAGNSGGPLLDETGKLVGVVFAGIETFEGINFAIPVYWLQRVLPSLYEEGEVSHPWIGAALHEGSAGLTVLYAAPDSPAARSGIQEGDILLRINSRPVASIRAVHSLLASQIPGRLVVSEWRQADGNEIEVLMELDRRPRSPILEAFKKDSQEDLILPLFGMKIKATGSTLWEKGYIITRVYQGSIADETGLSENDPFYWRGFRIEEEQKVALFQMIIKKRKAGFLESSIQLGAYVELDYFI